MEPIRAVSAYYVLMLGGAVFIACALATDNASKAAHEPLSITDIVAKPPTAAPTPEPAHQQLPQCVKPSPTLMPMDPCAEVADRQCPQRMAFVKKAFDATVMVHVSKYDPRIGVTYAAGTGAVIDAAGTVLTAYHVVENGRFTVAIPQTLGQGIEVLQGRQVEMQLVAHRAEMDLALLRPVARKPAEKLPRPFPLRLQPLAAGEDVWHFGRVSFWAHGPVRQIGIPFDTLKGVTQVAVPCRHGDSGAPFTDAQGNLVGVLLHKDNYDGRGNTYLLPVGTALDALGYPRPK